MTASAVLKAEPQPIVACTVSRDVQIFDLLIEDMETAVGDRWGDLGFTDAIAFMDQPEAATLEFVAIAIDQQDIAQMSPIVEVISAAKAHKVKVILITEDVGPADLHQLLRVGGDEFLPYPLPEGELSEAITRITTPEEAAPPPAETRTTLQAGNDRDGVVIAVQGMAGGTGATTLAVNLAWELAQLDPKDPPRVCILDLDLQYGTVATYLDLPRREAVLEILSDTEAMDTDAFMQALQTHSDKLHVLTSPGDLVPLDIVNSADINRVIDMARGNFDYVVIDLPTTVAEWSQAVLEAAHVYFSTIELEMRSAQNTLRLKRALQSEDLPFGKIRFVLNRAPSFTDLTGKTRVKRMAESLGISIELQLPDGGKPVAQNADNGVPLGESVPKNALRKEIAKLAKSVHDVNEADTAVAK